MAQEFFAAELGSFLKTRRERLAPEAVGVPRRGRRRSAGLRREEVAALAGVSADYYARLEQGRAPNPSLEVLEAIADALRLDRHERSHVRSLHLRLTLPSKAPETAVPFDRAARHLRLVSAVSDYPAMILDWRMDVVAWNPLMTTVLVDFATVPAAARNTTVLLFTDPEIRRRCPDWAAVARQNVGYLRAAAGRHPEDRRIGEVVARLAATSGQFREWWATHDIEEKSRGRKRFSHPLVGTIEYDYEALLLPGPLEEHLVVYTTTPGGTDEERLDHLRRLTRQAAGRPVPPLVAASGSDHRPRGVFAALRASRQRAAG